MTKIKFVIEQMLKEGNVKKIVLIVFLALIVQGCASSYKQLGVGGGYSQTQLDENMYNVSFRGNGYTSSERASDFMLLRCAELTLQNEYSYFVIIKSKNGTKRGSYTIPKTYNTSTSIQSYGNSIYGNSTTTTFGGQSIDVVKPKFTSTIICLKKKPVDIISYNAKIVFNSISNKYNLQK